ncbi:hypothetical protein M9H77_09960 [Catharanthus roseus]|uniref:Uncharacterized protein n=1 Tax=Catharanthus roseus TaxID=4058 RepID=A0ACC0C237_CATRO|nr:hypothetical protein M9H77_09960 [Catharanthus roseus]
MYAGYERMLENCKENFFFCSAVETAKEPKTGRCKAEIDEATGSGKAAATAAVAQKSKRQKPLLAKIEGRDLLQQKTNAEAKEGKIGCSHKLKQEEKSEAVSGGFKFLNLLFGEALE